MGLRPNSSDLKELLDKEAYECERLTYHGAHNSHPKAYVTRKIIAPHRAACELTWNSSAMPFTALE